MQAKQDNNIITKILFDKRFKLLRHLILFVVVFIISAGLIWYRDEENMTSVNKYIGLFFYITTLLGSLYFNIYVLVPHLLIKNKWLAYFCSLLGIVLLTLFLVTSLQDFFYENENKPIQQINYFIGIINLLSATISFCFLFAGAATFVIFKHWVNDLQRVNELEATTLQSELKLLESQINPHFLFNMLNNANIMIQEDPDMAVHIVEKLEDMLRYQMNDSSCKKVYLQEDIRFLTDFLELEKTRRDNFEYTILQDGNIENMQVPPLLFIPFVENAIKHNLDSSASSYVHLFFSLITNKLVFVCENSIPLKPVAKKTGGLGLANIQRRLNLLYNSNYWLEQTKTETTYRINLQLPINI